MRDVMIVKGDFDTAVKYAEAWEAATHAHVTGITVVSTGFSEIHFEYDEAVSDIELPEKCDCAELNDTRFVPIYEICVMCDRRVVEIGHNFCPKCEAHESYEDYEDYDE